MSQTPNATATLPTNRAPFSLREIAAATSGVLQGNDREICGVSTDTRAIENGSLFIALRGANFDGHNYLRQAQERGAIAAVVEAAPEAALLLNKEGLREVSDFPLVIVPDTTRALGDIARAHRRKFIIPVIGVTGSYGKTTTRALIAAALSPDYVVLSSQENFNNEIGVPLTLLQLDETHKAAVIEMGMRGAGQIAELARIAEPTIGVITNIGPQHIEFLGSIEAIADAKAELLEALPKDGIAILPSAKKYARILAQKAACRIVTFGTEQKADYQAQNTATQADGNISFTIRNAQHAIRDLRLSLPGMHNALNAAAALAVGDVLGVSVENAIRALENASVPGARMKIVRIGGITIIDDSYNAGPDSMRAALETLRDFPTARRRVAVLGAMKELGAWTEEEHRNLGVLSAFADELFCVGDETKATIESAGKGQWFASAEEAAPRARETVQSGDVVLIKGSRSVGLETVVSALDKG